MPDFISESCQTRVIESPDISQFKALEAFQNMKKIIIIIIIITNHKRLLL
jgi:hypothetical protein